MVTALDEATAVGIATINNVTTAYTGKAYSPYATKRGIPERPLWGDSHLHTALSMDAGLFGNRLSLRQAYKFARGDRAIINRISLPRMTWISNVPPYIIGSAAAFWTIQRLASF